MKSVIILVIFLFGSLFGIGQNVIDKEKLEVDDVPVFRPSEMPYLPSCSNAKGRKQELCTQRRIMELVRLNFVLPDTARSAGMEGTVYVKFIVNRTGKVVGVTVLKGVNKFLDKAAVEAVERLPDFIPGRDENGKMISVIFNIPIRIHYN